MRLAYHAVSYLVAATLPALLVGCGSLGTRSTSPSQSDALPSDSQSASPSVAKTSPAQTFAVGTRTISLQRSDDRPLPTTVWYPATGDSTQVTSDAEIAAGTFPLVLASHGLTSLPSDLSAITTRLAAAGFVVAAPTYPYTNRNATEINVTDVVNQPADALFVIDAVSGLGNSPDDPLYGHLDADNVAVAGHSAGGFTTAGILAAEHDARIKAAIIVSGGSLTSYTEPSASVLFIHGDADEVVPYATGRSAYTRLTWPKAFLTVLGGGHSEFLEASAPAFTPVVATITDFLRSTLYGDATAAARLPSDGATSSTQYEQQLG